MAPPMVVGLCLMLLLSSVGGIDILTLLGSDTLDSIANTPADLPPPMLPPFVTEEVLNSLSELDHSIQGRGVEEKGDAISREFQLQSQNLRLVAAQQYEAFVISQARVHRELGCYHESAPAVSMRNQLDLHSALNQSQSKQALRGREMTQLRLSYQSEKAVNQRSRDSLLHLTRLIEGQREANYSGLRFGSIFDGAFENMEEKLEKAANMVKLITTRHDVSDRNLTSSYETISKELQCVSCEKTRVAVQHLSNATKSKAWVASEAKCASTDEKEAGLIARAKSDTSTKTQTLDDLVAASDAIATHRSQMEPQNEDTKAVTAKLSQAILGGIEP